MGPGIIGRTRKVKGERFIVVMLVLLMAVPSMPAEAARTVTISAPNGGETVMGGSTFKITWNVSSVEGAVKLWYSTDGGRTYPGFIATVTNIDVSNMYPWAVPNNINSTKVRLKIDWITRMDPPFMVIGSDTSDANFTVRPGIVLRFTQVPARVGFGAYYLLRWDLDDAVNKTEGLAIQYRYRTNASVGWTAWRPGGANLSCIPPEQGGIWWAPDYYRLGQLQLKISAHDRCPVGNVLAENVSGIFDISSLWIELQSPNGGETLTGGRTWEIKWRTPEDPEGAIIGVGLYYSLDGGSTWIGIVEGSENDFSHVWNVPAGLDSTRLRLRVDALRVEWGIIASDFSDGNCTLISDPNTITVSLMDPNPYTPRGIAIPGNHSYGISWSMTGSRSLVAMFRLYLSTDNGTTYSHFTNASSAVSGTEWHVPAIDTNEAKVKVELLKTDSTVKTAVSNQPFVIFTNIPCNRPPKAIVGPPQQVNEGTRVYLDGTGSYDPDRESLTYSWRQVDTSGYSVALTDAGTARPYFVPKIRDFQVDMLFRLTVSDGHSTEPDYLENVGVATVTVDPLPPTVTGIWPTRIWAGMKLYISGTEMAGAQVYLGDTLTGTFPTSPVDSVTYDPDTGANVTILETVPHKPLLLTIRTAAGACTCSTVVDVYPKPQYCMDYGFRFGNPSKDYLDYPWLFWEEGTYHDTFGDDVYLNLWICIGIPYWTPSDGWQCWGYEVSQPIAPDPFAAVLFLAGFCWLASNGECYGASATSLQFYHDVLDAYDFNRSTSHVNQLDFSGELERRIDWMHGSQISSEALGWMIVNQVGDLAPGSEPDWGMGIFLHQVREAVASGELGIVSILDGGQGHAMVPYLVEDVDATHTRIYVYDINRPQWSEDARAVNSLLYSADEHEDHPPYIEIDRGPTYWEWSYVNAGNAHWGGATGISFLPYHTVNGSRTLPLTPEGIYNFIMGAATSSVTDGNGGRMAIEDNGSFTTEIPGGRPMVFYDGAGPDHSAYFLPQGNYTSNIKGVRDGTYNMTFISNRSAYSIEDAQVGAGSRDTAGIVYEGANQYMGALHYKTSDAQKKYQTTHLNKFGTRERVYRISNATLFGDSEAVINTTPDYNAIAFFNNGSHSFTFDVEFQGNVVDEKLWNSSDRPTGLPTASRKGITIGPCQTLVIRPSTWLDLGHANVTIDGETPVQPPPAKRVPGAIWGLSATATQAQVNLSWNAPVDDGGSPITGYRILRGLAVGNLSLMLTISNGTSYVDPSVSAGTTYFYAVMAVNAIGSGNATTSVEVTVPKKPDGGGGGGNGASAGGISILPLILMIIIAVGAIGVAVMMARKKRPPPDDSPRAESGTGTGR